MIDSLEEDTSELAGKLTDLLSEVEEIESELSGVEAETETKVEEMKTACTARIGEVNAVIKKCFSKLSAELQTSTGN